MTSILALNVANPSVSRVQPLLEWLWTQPDEVLVLTELGPGPGSSLIVEVCETSGYDVVATDRSSLGVLVVGRGTTVRADTGLPPPTMLPGRVAPVLVETSGAPSVRLLGVYGAASDPVRYSGKAQRQRKREWLASFDRWLAGWLAAGTGGRSALVGDLNIVDPYDTTGLRYVLPEERDEYRRLVTDHGLVDAFRHRQPEGPAPSWVDHSGAGCRYDHAFVTAGLLPSVRACSLVDEPRTLEISDHSALRVTLGPAVPG